MVDRGGEPWVVYEDVHLLAVHKPAGITTHRADTLAQDGMHEWVQRQRPGRSLSVLHRLDKGTSGVLVFGKTREANQALAAQFAERTVAKTYELLTGSEVRAGGWCDAPIDGAPASTELVRLGSGSGAQRYRAHPRSGRTHQVRIHARALDIPVLGDEEHDGAPAARLFLHAARLGLHGPDGSSPALAVDPPASFDRVVSGSVGPTHPALHALVAHEARAALFDPADTDAYLWIDRDHDGWPDVRVERLGQVALVLDYRDGSPRLSPDQLDALHQTLDLRGVYRQRRPRGGGGGPAERVTGSAPARFEVEELGARYLIDLDASATSSGLFLDQRETRRELLTSDLAGRTVLNAFAHTGSLSVAAARAGAETLTLDLSKHYLEWARENLRLNEIDPADHDFIYGDALDWMDRLGRKGRRFDVVLVDPPSSSTSRRKGAQRWSVARDLSILVERAAVLCAPGGRVYVSTNFRRMTWPRFLDHVEQGLAGAGRTGTASTRTLPLDHRSGPGDPPYLKAAWITLDP